MMEYLAMKEMEQKALKRDYMIAISNQVLDKARMGLTAQQHDTLDFMLKEIKPEDTPDTVYSISIEDYCRINNIVYDKSSKNYNDLKKNIAALNSKCTWIDTSEVEETFISWFKNYKINKETGVIKYQVYDTIAPFLFNLIDSGNYTAWAYRDTRAMRGRYSKHLYKILLRYMGSGISNPVIPLDKLKMKLGADSYSRYPDFRRYVLEVAKKEINKVTLMNMDYEPLKLAGSRSITHISFTVFNVKYWEQQKERLLNNRIAFGDGEEELYPIFSTEQE